jgi:acyl-CoA synthetase (NDP forming)
MESSATSARRFDLHRLLRPRSVAVAGASPDPRSIGGAILRNLRNSRFNGQLTLVSQTRDRIDDQPCVKSLRDIPEGTDAVILNLPRVAIRQALEDCVARKVGGAVVFATGFGESGEAGRAEQEAISTLCREAGLALLGPNCLGFANYVDGMCASFEDLNFSQTNLAQTNLAPGARRVAVIAQSGATAANVRSSLQARGIAVSHVVSTGNEAVLRIDDFITYVIEEGVSAIALYVEQVRNPAAFLTIARHARERAVPIVMLHPGRSARARAATQSHTGALTGDYAVMKTAVENEAVVLVETMDELFDATAILQRFPRPSTGGVAIITNSGAIRAMALDSMEDVGLPVARLNDPTVEKLGAIVPDYVEIDNPLDLGAAGYADAGIFTTTTQAVLDDPSVGSVIWAMTGGGPRQQLAKVEAMIPLSKRDDKPLILTITGDGAALDPECLAAAQKNEIVLFRSPERTLRAMAALHRHALAREAATKRRALRRDVPLLRGSGAIAEYVGKDWLREMGVPVPAGQLVQSVEDARRAAKTIGYPVVIKAQAPSLQHKSDVGGVIVGIGSESELNAAWDRLHANLRAAGSDIALDGVLVEQMVPPGLEMVVGGKSDPKWGPVIMVGLGGVWIEALRAVELLPPDITHEHAVQRIKAMKGGQLLGAFRGQPPRDVDALANLVLTLGDAMRANPSIREIDINPVMVFAAGAGVMALDALIIKDPDSPDTNAKH